jgi:nucleotide-binding universal stress UspA family protein
MKRFRNILCVITRQSGDGQALARAVRLAQSNQARLRVVALVDRISLGMGMPEGGPISARLQAALLDEGEQRLQAIVEAHRGRVPLETGTRVGATFLEVIHEVLQHEHDLLIKAAEDPAWLERLFGSDDMHLLRKCPCPVWLLKPAAPRQYRSILAAVDLDDDCAPEELQAREALNDQVLQLAASLAVGDFSSLHVGHAWEVIGESALRTGFMQTPSEQVDRYVQQVYDHRQENMDALLQRLPDGVDPDVIELQSHLVKGAPREAIPMLAQRVEADLVVMGTVARTRTPGFIVGNTAEMILSQIGCSVLAVKPPGFVSPVTLRDAHRP